MVQILFGATPQIHKQDGNTVNLFKMRLFMKENVIRNLVQETVKDFGVIGLIAAENVIQDIKHHLMSFSMIKSEMVRHVRMNMVN